MNLKIQRQSPERFSSGLALFLAAIGMAIGAGNIWRFPRLAGEYGGSFLIPWLIFLFLWSLPLAIFEFSLGRKTRLGVIGSFVQEVGTKFAWMGGFITFCTISIMFYYSIVTGWAALYAGKTIVFGLPGTNSEAVWQDFISGSEPIVGLFIVIILVFLIMRKKLTQGLERINKILIPTLFALLVSLAVLALTLPGSELGLKHLFEFDPKDLWNVKVWLEGLTQSAWSTGAGWGLFLTYGAYMNERDGIVSNALFAGLGNNLASIIAALAIVPSVFALASSPTEATELLKQGNQGLAFIAIPGLLNQVPGGYWAGILFFIALFFAAFSSLLSMVELGIKNLVDFGIPRKSGIYIILFFMLIFGLPSALYIEFLNNQDWVWGLGLILSGSFYIIAGIIMAYKNKIKGIINSFNEIRKNVINIAPGDLRLPYLFNYIWIILLPVEFIAMIIWWLGQDIVNDPAGLFDIFSEYSIGTVLFQWLILLIILKLFNNKMAVTLGNHLKGVKP